MAQESSIPPPAFCKKFFERQELRCMKEQSIVKTLDPENVFAFGRAI
jgi:hypothetical protein